MEERLKNTKQDVYNNYFNMMNEENIDKLNDFIDKNYDNILQILIPPEMIEYFKSLELYSESYTGKYKGKWIIQNNYIPCKQINFVFKSGAISFNLPSLNDVCDD